MKINLQDSNSIISYIQIFLKEYSGLSLKRLDNAGYYKGTYTKNHYIISMNSPLRVTGIYDIATYQATALYMAFNYPNEQFPILWNQNTIENTWYSTPYEPDKLTKTLDKLIYECFNKINEEDRKTSRVDDSILIESRIEDNLEDPLIYTEIINDYTQYLTWNELLNYFSLIGDVNDLYNYLTDKVFGFIGTVTTVYEDGSFTNEDLNNVLIDIILRNSELSASLKDSVQLNERILSYFFNEVVTPLSEKDEIYRIQKLMYSYIPIQRSGNFDEQMTEDIIDYQTKFLETLKSSSFEIPTVYSGFKVTGYVDPWTEKVIRERGVIR